MASRMQTSVPELTDLSNESAHTFDLYGVRFTDAEIAAWSHVSTRTIESRRKQRQFAEAMGAAGPKPSGLCEEAASESAGVGTR